MIITSYHASYTVYEPNRVDIKVGVGDLTVQVQGEPTSPKELDNLRESILSKIIDVGKPRYFGKHIQITSLTKL